MAVGIDDFLLLIPKFKLPKDIKQRTRMGMNALIINGGLSK